MTRPTPAIADAFDAATRPRSLWAIQYRSRNQLDGVRAHFVNHDCLPMLFTTRRAAEEAITANGTSWRRPDLRAEPHGWLKPKAVRVVLALQNAATPEVAAKPSPQTQN
jgi:hypothetical protein